MIQSRISAKAQTTVPRTVCAALGLHEDDTIGDQIDGDRVILTRVAPLPLPADDPFAAFTEWSGDADAKAHPLGTLDQTRCARVRHAVRARAPRGRPPHRLIHYRHFGPPCRMRFRLTRSALRYILPAMPTRATNRLYYGDNLDVLRDHVEDASVDLVYLDPPFNSDASYNILFKSPTGGGADASIEAFDDTWSWGPTACAALMDVTQSGNHSLHVLMKALRTAIGENAMMAYLAMMAVRLIELHRVLKPTGSLYLHCDPTASHYLKLVLDAVFGPANFRNEIIWCYRKWSIAQRQFASNHDTILFYSKSAGRQTFNTQYVAPSPATMKRWKGQKQQAVIADGVRHASSHDGEEARSAMPDWWEVSILNPNAKERLGYPTQKPVALLQRIVAASTAPGDVVLDPFCGCGTAVDAAQKLGRRWIGIDVTHLAIGLIEKRLREGYGEAVRFETIGVPRDLASARRLAVDDPHQFQAWITLKLGGWPWMGGKKGGDRGVDGYFYYVGAGGQTETGVISVKAGLNVSPTMVRDLGRVMARDGHAMGLFVCATEPTRGMRDEAASHGLIETEFGRFPALQCFTLADLFDDRHPRLPPLVSPNRRAPRVETRASHREGAQGELI